MAKKPEAPQPPPLPFKTAAEEAGITPPEGVPDPRLSQAPGLVELKDSQVPALGNGGMVSHVQGPGQAPVDPIAAGLDTGYSPPSKNELRATTLTGTVGAGPRPSTYAEKPDGQAVQQAAPATGETVKPPSNQEVAQARLEGEPPDRALGGDPLKGT